MIDLTVTYTDDTEAHVGYRGDLSQLATDLAEPGWLEVVASSDGATAAAAFINPAHVFSIAAYSTTKEA